MNTVKDNSDCHPIFAKERKLRDQVKVVVGGVHKVVFVGGKPGSFPLTGFGEWTGEGRERGKGRVGETTCLTSPHWLLPQISSWVYSGSMNT